LPTWLFDFTTQRKMQFVIWAKPKEKKKERMTANPSWSPLL
jgi:hypothetical protein